jgi:arylsulfatase A-like enzyme
MNVLLVVIDCLRADRIAQAERFAPNIHRLAERGNFFRQAFTNGPYTNAAMPALIYSAYYSNFLARRGQPGFRSLPQVMREGGYTTMAVQTNTFMCSDFGWGRGFDYYDESFLPWFRPTPRARLERHITEKRPAEGLASITERALLYLLYGKGAADCRTVSRKFVKMLGHAFRPGARHFALLHYMDLHEPVVILPRAWRRGLARLHPHRISELAHANPESLTPRQWGFLRDSYDAALGMLDEELGRLLASKPVRRFLENGILVITADHGEELGERCAFGHGTRFYDQLLRVPLIIKLPGQKAGRELDDMVCHLDVGPTLAEVCGLPPNAGFAGRSLAGVLNGGGPIEDRPLIVEALAGGREWIHAVRTRSHKLIEASRELYDLTHDPLEAVNLYPTRGDLLPALERVIEEHRTHIAAPGAVLEKDLVNERMRDRLRGLGYLD